MYGDVGTLKQIRQGPTQCKLHAGVLMLTAMFRARFSSQTRRRGKKSIEVSGETEFELAMLRLPRRALLEECTSRKYILLALRGGSHGQSIAPALR